ncbi:MAG: hypothetical protein FJ149_09420 [Euryarchaeota archaeon]|nr:hypothetical protein [Euryarchaeota archaeon]
MRGMPDALVQAQGGAFKVSATAGHHPMATLAPVENRTLPWLRNAGLAVLGAGLPLVLLAESPFLGTTAPLENKTALFLLLIGPIS